MLRRDGVAPEETAGGGAAQSTGAGVEPDGEVRGAFDDEVEGDACGRLAEEEEPEAHVDGFFGFQRRWIKTCTGVGYPDACGEMTGEGDHKGCVIEVVEELLELDWIDGGGVKEAEDTVGVGELLVYGEGDGVKAGGDIPSKKVLCFGKAALGGEFVAAEGVRMGDELVWRNGAPDEEGREGCGGLSAANDLGRVEGDHELVVDEAVGRGEDRGGNWYR